jgi:hypothetical protein
MIMEYVGEVQEVNQYSQPANKWRERIDYDEMPKMRGK